MNKLPVPHSNQTLAMRSQFIGVVRVGAARWNKFFGNLSNLSIMCFLCLLQTGDKCDPLTFAACSQLCHTAVCQFFNYEKENYVNYLHAFNIFGIFWGLFFVSALGEIILAATFATWYWTFNKSDVPFFVLTVSIGRTLR